MMIITASSRDRAERWLREHGIIGVIDHKQHGIFLATPGNVDHIRGVLGSALVALDVDKFKKEERQVISELFSWTNVKARPDVEKALQL